MTDFPNPVPLLTAAHLQEWEDTKIAAEPSEDCGSVLVEPPTEPPITLQDAAESVRRIRYHEGEKARVRAMADEMMAPLLAQIDQIKAWATEATEYRDRRISLHQSRLIAYARLTSPDAKHVDIPGARIQAKQPAPKWNYGDEKTLVKLLQEHNCGALIRNKPELDKDGLKNAAFFEGATVFVPNMDGEAIELPVTVTTPPVEYTVKLTEPK